MSVAYEPRSFIHEGGYPPIGDEHDHTGDHSRFTDSDVAEQLSHYTNEAAMLPDDREVLGDDRDLLHDTSSVSDAARLELAAASFPSPLHVPVHPPSLPDDLPGSKEPSPGASSPSSSRNKSVAKPEREAVKQTDGKFHCPLIDCKEDIRTFSRKCEYK